MEEDGDDDQEKRKHMQDELCNLKGKYEEIMRKMRTSFTKDQLLISTSLPYSAKVMAIPLPPKF